VRANKRPIAAVRALVICQMLLGAKGLAATVVRTLVLLGWRL
jgi:hypothetical protein